jgi:aspartyl-tRNA(Asn)/glutamyl-tRNA(Gln) amidotransferase subunit A
MPTNTLSRRSFVARTGGALVATSTLASLLASRARAAEHGLPTTGLPDATAVAALGKRLEEHDVLELAALLAAGRTTSVAITQAYLTRIGALNGPYESYGASTALNAFARVDVAGALADAARADAVISAARATGDPIPFLTGIPLAFSDAIAVEGFATLNGTAAFTGNVAVRDATAVERLRGLGVVPIGITTCSPFSDRAGGLPIGVHAGNAWDVKQEPGGTAEGTAVAPVARLVPATIGLESDGGVVVASAVNGASAITPSLGLVPTTGAHPTVPGRDTIAPVARSVRDAALILNGLIGSEVLADPVSGSQPADYPLIPITPRTTGKPLAGLTIGVPTNDWLRDGSDVKTGVKPSTLWASAYQAAFDRFTGELAALGATVKEVEVLDLADPAKNGYLRSADVLGTTAGLNVTPETADALSGRYEVKYTAAVQTFAATASTDNAATLLAHYGRTPATGGAATYVAAIAYEGGVTWGARREAEARRRALSADYRAALTAAGVDLLVALPVGGPVGARGGSTFPVHRAYLDLANVIGWPTVTLPIGAGGGLPISAQLWGPRFSEPELVQTAIDYQARYPQWHTARPAGV